MVADTHEAMWRGIRQVRPGNRVGDIGAAIQGFAEQAGHGVVTQFFGHGIGQHFHESPMVAHFGEAGTGALLEVGMVITVEPMLNAGGGAAVRVLDDQWTVVTQDGALSAQWEHMVLVTEDGHEVLTLRADQDQGLRYGGGGESGGGESGGGESGGGGRQ